MARPKTAYVNEMKTRVNDKTWEAVQQFRKFNRVDSEARAISQLLELALFGVVGSIPEPLLHDSPQSSLYGPALTTRCNPM